MQFNQSNIFDNILLRKKKLNEVKAEDLQKKYILMCFTCIVKLAAPIIAGIISAFFTTSSIVWT